jgi:hypothetical protein
MNDEQKRIAEAVQIAVLIEQNKNIVENFGELKELLQTKYVTVDEFRPVKQIVYGMVGVILTAILVSLIAMVINK